MLDTYSGATRVLFIVGDPIAQVKSPAGVTATLRQRGLDAVVVPAHVAPQDLADFLATCARMRNVDGVIVTVPHKFAALPACSALSARARSIGAVNVMRRDAQGGWYGDMCDGEAHVDGLRALLVGAGGAGSAIAHALADAGIAHLAVHDADAPRRSELLRKLAAYSAMPCSEGSADARGFDLVVNATPLGMREGDPLPIDLATLSAHTFVSDVVTVPELPPLMAAARARGCPTLTGTGMFHAVRERIVSFYLQQPQ